MLVRLIYVSRAHQPLSPEALATLMKSSRAYNTDAGITGVLMYADGVFLQLLEGGRAAVNTLYNRITRDSRHHDVVLLSYADVGERRFAGWAMGQANVSRLNPGILLKYSERPVLEPHSLTGAATLALFDELVATAAITCSA